MLDDELCDLKVATHGVSHFRMQPRRDRMSTAESADLGGKYIGVFVVADCSSLDWGSSQWFMNFVIWNLARKGKRRRVRTLSRDCDGCSQMKACRVRYSAAVKGEKVYCPDGTAHLIDS